MSESNRDGFQALEWILHHSEQGMYLVVAEEERQEEIARRYGEEPVAVYDYKRHPGAYSFGGLREWVLGRPETKVFMIVNFQLSVRDEESLKRLNFSRDMLDGLGKNFIFLITPYGDDRLARGAYDFYSFVKLRVLFDSYKEKPEKEEWEAPEEEEWIPEHEERPVTSKQKLKRAYIYIDYAKEEKEKANYAMSERMLAYARRLKEGALGPEHLEVAELDYKLAEVYMCQKKYEKARDMFQRSVIVREKVLGEEHPDTVSGYRNLAEIYEHLGKYEKAEALRRKIPHNSMG